MTSREETVTTTSTQNGRIVKTTTTTKTYSSASSTTSSSNSGNFLSKLKFWDNHKSSSSSNITVVQKEPKTQLNNNVTKATPKLPAAKITPATSNKINTAGFTDFQIESLKTHNEYRKKHGVGPLKLNKDLCKVAQNWANTIASRGKMQHSTDGKYGENIYWSSGKDLNATYCVKCWYDEINLYNFNKGGFSSGTGHFTQVVWRNSHELGVAFAQKGDEIFIVANYDPPGNYVGQYEDNVPRLL